MAEIEIRYSYLDDMAEASKNLSEQLSSYANELAQKVNSRIGSVTDGSSSNLENANYYINAKIGRLEEKSTAYSNLGKAVSSLRVNAETIDTGVARQISQNYDKFIGKHQELKIADWKAQFLQTMSWLRDIIPVFDFILNLRENILDGIADIGKAIKHWYKCEGGKEIVDIVLAVGAVIITVALVVASFPASGLVAIAALIGSVIGAVNAVNNLVTSVFSYAAIKNGDPAWAKIYGDTNTFSDSLRLTNFNNGFFNRLSNGAAFIVDFVDMSCSFVALGKTLFDVGKYLNSAGNIVSYFKTVNWSNGKIVANSEGIVQTKFTVQSVWRGIKSFACDLPIADNDVRGIRTILKDNLIADIKDTYRYTVSKPGIFRSIIFPKDSGTVRSAIDVQGRELKQLFRFNRETEESRKLLRRTLSSINRTYASASKLITGKSDVLSFIKENVMNSYSTTRFIDSIPKLNKKIDTFKLNWEN